MAAKRSSGKRRSRARTHAAYSTDNLGQLRAAVDDIRRRLESEAKKRGFKIPGFEQTAQAPKRFLNEINDLRKKGYQLGSKVRRALANPDPRRIQEQAKSMLGAMRAQLEQRTNEVREKGEQLNDLLRRSARQAFQILQSKPRSARRSSSRRAGS